MITNARPSKSPAKISKGRSGLESLTLGAVRLFIRTDPLGVGGPVDSKECIVALLLLAIVATGRRFLVEEYSGMKEAMNNKRCYFGTEAVVVAVVAGDLMCAVGGLTTMSRFANTSWPLLGKVLRTTCHMPLIASR